MKVVFKPITNMDSLFLLMLGASVYVFGAMVASINLGLIDMPATVDGIVLIVAGVALSIFSIVSNIIDLGDAGALAALAILILKPYTGNPALASLIYILCIIYIVLYCYTAYRNNYDPMVQAKQAAMIKDTQDKILKRFKK